MRRRDVFEPLLLLSSCAITVAWIAHGQWLPALVWLGNTALFTWIALRQASP
jgi:hypothetical protein